MISKLSIFEEQATNAMAAMTKFTLVITFNPDKGDLIIKAINDRLSELETRELIEDITTTENEASLESVFFSNNRMVSTKSLENSFSGIHDSVDAVVYKETIDDTSNQTENAVIEKLNLQMISEAKEIRIQYDSTEEVANSLAFYADKMDRTDIPMVKSLGFMMIYYLGRGAAMKIIRQAIISKIESRDHEYEEGAEGNKQKKDDIKNTVKAVADLLK